MKFHVCNDFCESGRSCEKNIKLSCNCIVCLQPAKLTFPTVTIYNSELLILIKKVTLNQIWSSV